MTVLSAIWDKKWLYYLHEPYGIENDWHEPYGIENDCIIYTNRMG